MICGVEMLTTDIKFRPSLILPHIIKKLEKLSLVLKVMKYKTHVIRLI